MIYLFLNDAAAGPFTAEAIEAMRRAGTITSATLFCREGEQQWKLLSEMKAPVAPLPPVAELKSKISLLASFAALLLFCFPWLDVQCSGKTMATQSGFQAIYGGATLSDQMNRPGVSKTKGEDKTDLGFAYLTGGVLLLAAGATGASFIILRGGNVPRALTPERLCAAAVLLLAGQVALGFPAEKQVDEASAKMQEKKAGRRGYEFGDSIASAMSATVNFGVKFSPALYGELLALGVPALFMLNGLLNKMKKVQ